MNPADTSRRIVFARMSLVLAAVLWSTSSLFVRVLQQPTFVGVHEPHLDPLQVGFFRGIFAGLVMIPLIRRADVRFRPAMGLMMLCFGIMTGCYISALSLGPAGNAILLQNTAPVWVYIVSVLILRKAADPRTLPTILAAMLGAAVIIVGNWPSTASSDQATAQRNILLLATASGMFYAGVVLFLTALQKESPAWLTLLNMFGGAIVTLTYVAITDGIGPLPQWLLEPTARQLGFIALFGFLQLALPYWLFARSVKVVGPLEAGVITLIEPVMNPVWAYLLSPETDTPTVPTLIGGGILVGALLWRYRPRREIITPESIS
ncbi:MAG: DMT family transporter [Gemmataceae bacterium]